MENLQSRLLFEELIYGGLRYNCLSALFDLGINTILTENGGFMSASEISSKIHHREINPGPLKRLLRYLACFDVIEEKYGEGDNDEVIFKANDVLKQLPFNGMYFGKTLFPRIDEALDASRSDENTLVQKVFGKSYWEKVAEEKEMKQLFTNTMFLLTEGVKDDVTKIAQIIQSEGKSDASIIDIGGNTGELLKYLKSELPSLQCANFDLANIIEKNEPINEVEMIAGDMFNVETLPSKDIYFMKNILHDWSDEKCIDILKNIHEKMNDGGLVMSVNYMLPEPGQQKTIWRNMAVDLTMLVLFNSARERTEKEFREIHYKAGFEIKRCEVIGIEQRPAYVLVAVKMV